MPKSKEISVLIAALEEFRDVDPDITLPSILAFLYYVEMDDEKENQYRMEQRLGMSGATASRATSHWMEWKRPRVQGLHMIDSIADPEDRRFKRILLNRKGLTFVDTLTQKIKSTCSQHPASA